MPAPDPVSYRHQERAVQEILFSFFSTYFTGTPHAGPDGAPVEFPDCSIAFNDVEIKELTKPLIHIVFTDLRKTRHTIEGDRIRVYSNLTASIVVRVNADTGPENTADFLCREVSSDIVELFDSNQRADLARLGMRKPRIPNGPQVVSIPHYQARHLVSTTQLQYFVPLLAA